MNQFIQNMVGMGGMTDQVIANDFLMSAKAGIRNYTIAITEAATPELRTVLREQLQAAIQTHENITSYMMSKGYYHPHNLSEQLQVDLTASQTATNLAQQ
ncbi:spore coat protein [Neobacillus sp. YIM B06451]|jgi:similar to spore coat protein|uniref:spore coat protein n=1 Tax=Neobacillus sp. YIM B06451 TaxID=3070994 RepID=UPI0029317927|nr:spore coat protein [Neobacillus sp. YIM B06451]